MWLGYPKPNRWELVCRAITTTRTRMKVSDIKTWVVATPPPHKGGAYWIFLRLTTDDGIAGYGEVYGVPFGSAVVCQMIENVFERHVAGESPFNIEKMWRIIYSVGFVQRPDDCSITWTWVLQPSALTQP